MNPRLEFGTPNPERKIARDVAKALLFHYTEIDDSGKKWRKRHKFLLAKGAPAGEHPLLLPTTYDELLRHLDGTCRFDPKKFGVRGPLCPWLDHSLNLGTNSSAIQLKSPPALGASFPLKPTVHGAGSVISGTQVLILKRINALRTKLVTDGDQYQRDEWQALLKSLVSESVSLIDATLHHLYCKAKYDCRATWKFDEKELAKKALRIGGRLEDKLGWVHSITGRALEISEEKPALTRLRVVRNHLQHWDPPVFAFSLRDAADWLNDIPAIGRINWSIRRAAGSPLCLPLIELLLAKEVIINPPGCDAAKPQPSGTGYASARWPPSQST